VVTEAMKMETEVQSAEYVLIGTLLSAMLAIMAAMLIKSIAFS